MDEVEVVDNYTNCMADRIPTKVYAAAAISGMVCGGLDYELNDLSSCWHLNPNGTWTAGEQMLEKRFDFTMTAVEDEIIVIGGQTKYNEGLNSIVEHYNVLGDLEIIGWQFWSVPGAYDRDQVCNRLC